MELRAPRQAGADGRRKYPLHAQAPGQQRPGIEHERPLPGEAKDDRGLERLHLGSLLHGRERAQRDPEQHHKDDVFQSDKALVDAKRN